MRSEAMASSPVRRLDFVRRCGRATPSVQWAMARRRIRNLSSDARAVVALTQPVRRADGGGGCEAAGACAAGALDAPNGARVSTHAYECGPDADVGDSHRAVAHQLWIHDLP